jgi:2-oxoglutarate ferredoxin oxidoreductase subunit beta
MPGELVMGAQGAFFARVVDTEPKMMREVMIAAAENKGTSVVEVLQNCIIFANQVHKEITGKDVRDDHQIYLKDGEPMIFGKERNKGLIMERGRLKAVTIGENGYTMDDILIHDVKDPDDTTHYMLSRMSLPELPVAMGVIRSYETTVYEDLLEKQIAAAKEKSKIKTVNDLLHSGHTFEVE